MRVCHITSVHPRNDIRIFVKECKALAKEHHVTLIVADSLGNQQEAGIAIYDVGKSTGGRLQRIYETTAKIYAKVLELTPDVIHLHDPELMAVGKKLAKAGYKVIYDVHEDVPKQVLNKQWLPKIIRPLVSWLIKLNEKQTSAKLSGIICATEIIANRFKRYNSNTIAIHNYPILAELANNSVDWDSRDLDLCYVGSISQTRGILPLSASLQTSGCQLELAGAFSNVDIEQQLKNSPGFKQINYHGVVGRAAIAELLSRVRVGIVTLLPTPSYVESLPIKLFEYMLAGIPVVASDFELWRPIVAGNNCGLMVNPADPAAIAAACLELIKNPTQAARMGANGRRAVIEHYVWEQEQLKLLEFYRNLV